MSEFKGLTRFHKVTIGAGAAMLLLLAWRFYEVGRNFEKPVYLWMAAGSLLCAVALILYLRVFFKRGIS